MPATDSASQSRLLLRYVRNPALLDWMNRRTDEDTATQLDSSGTVRFDSGAMMTIQAAVDWPEGILGFRTHRDTEIRPLNGAGARLMQTWSSRIHAAVFAWTDGHAWLAHRAAPSCPICGHRTLTSRGSYEICMICGWEDDGLADHHPISRSNTNNTTPALVRSRYWSALATPRERPWWGRLDPEPSFDANDHADALLRILGSCSISTDERALMRRALIRLRPCSAQHSQALKLLHSSRHGDLSRDRGTNEPYPLNRQPSNIRKESYRHSPLHGSSARACHLGGRLGHGSSRLGSAQLLRSPPRRLLTPEDVHTLVSSGHWDLLEKLAEARLLNDPQVVARMTAELEAWRTEPNWRRWNRLLQQRQAALAWRFIWPEAKRRSLRRRVAEALLKDGGKTAWLLADIACLVQLPLPSHATQAAIPGR